MFPLWTKKVRSKWDILQKTCTKWPLCKEPDLYTLVEIIHRTEFSCYNTWSWSLQSGEQTWTGAFKFTVSSSCTCSQTLSFQRSWTQHVWTLFWDGISHSLTIHSVHKHKDGLSLRKYLENSASSNIIYTS